LKHIKFLVFIVIAAIVSFVSVGFADNFTFIEASNIVIDYNGQHIVWGTEPVYCESILYVPLRDLMPVLDFSLFTNRRSLLTTLQRHSDNFQIIIEEGSPIITVGGKQENISNDVRIIKNRIYVPFINFIEKIGYRAQKDKKLFTIVPVINSISVENNSFIIEGVAPFEYKVDYYKQKRKLQIRLRGYISNKTVSQEKLEDRGIESVAVKQVDKSNLDTLFEVTFLEGTKYNLYKYEGRNVIELEVIPHNSAALAKRKEDIKAIFENKEKNIEKSINVTAKPKENEPLTNNIKVEQTKVITTTSRFDKPSHNSIWLPNLKDRKQLDFSVSGKDVLLKAPFTYQDKSLMVPLKLVFEKAGYNVHINADKHQATIYRDDGIDYLISAGQLEIQNRGVNKNGALILDTPPKIINGDMYVPLIAFARIIGMGVRWDSKLEKVFVNHRIYEVVYEESAGTRQITIKCTGEIRLDSVFEVVSPSMLLITIPNTNLDVPDPIIEINDEKIKSYRLAQLTNNNCRIAIDTKGKIPYGVVDNDNILEGTIRFAGELTSVLLKSNKDVSEIVLQSSSKITPIIQKINDPFRLVIDVPDIVLKTPQFYEGDGKIIKRVRASQYQWNPLVTRVVVELEKDAYYNTQRNGDDKLLSVVLSLKDIKELKEKVVEELKAIIPKKEPSLSPLLKDKIIVIEAGHGGRDPGCIGIGGTLEKEPALKTSKIIQEELAQRGAKVMMARESDVYMSLNDRVFFANKNRADVFISVHYNSFVNGTISGTETFYSKPIDQALASAVHKAMVEKLKRTDKGTRKAMLYVLNYTTMPAICIEPVFLSNKWDELLANDENFQKKVALAVCQGIEEYFKNVKGGKK